MKLQLFFFSLHQGYVTYLLGTDDIHNHVPGPQQNYHFPLNSLSEEKQQGFCRGN